MDQLIQVFGIDWRVLIAQIIVFVILYFAFHKFALKPILDFVQERTAKIEKGVADAKAAADKLEDATAEHEALVAEARKEAQTIIATAREQAEKQAEDAKEKGKEELRAIADRAKAQIAEDRERVLRETQEQAVELVMAATEKLLKEKMDPAADKAYIEKTINELS